MVGSKFWLVAIVLMSASVFLGWFFVIAPPLLILPLYAVRLVVDYLRVSWRKMFKHSISPSRSRVFITAGSVRTRAGRRFETELAQTLKKNHLHGCACIVERPNFSQGTLRLWGERGSATVALNAQNTKMLVENIFHLAKSHLVETNWQECVTPCSNCNRQTCPTYWQHIGNESRFYQV